MLAATQTNLALLKTAFERMRWVTEMARVYDENRDVAKYVHSTSRGHEAVQLAIGMALKPFDFVYPYYRDESIVLGIGMTPYDLMLQLLAKRDDPFSGGRTYYAHPSLRRPDFPQIPHQSSATGMQAIPSTGAAHGMKIKEKLGLANYDHEPPVVVCSLGDGSLTEGEVSEAFQMAVLHELPILYLVQDNDWGISASVDEMRAMNSVEFARGFKGLQTFEVDGTDFEACHSLFEIALNIIRTERRPLLIRAEVPLIGHHTSGVRREWYRPADDLAAHMKRDPTPKLRTRLKNLGVKEKELKEIEDAAKTLVEDSFARAKAAPDPRPEDLTTFIYAPTEVTQEKGERTPKDGKEIVMVDAALHAMYELFDGNPEALLYGQDVGYRIGGVFREAATMAQKYGNDRVFNTPIQEAYIVGSTCGMSAVGLKPIVEVQFADYIWPGVNQLFTELSRSYYLSDGKWPVQSLIRVPIGAYGGGGPYHSSSVESAICNIRGIKVVYPSNAADMKGLFKAAFHDPNPVVLFEHKGLYWSKVPGTKEARTIEPDADYIVPIGKGRVALSADSAELQSGSTCVVITYGMGVYWAMNAARERYQGRVEVIDLRSLVPYDWELVAESVKKHGKAMVLTEEPIDNGFSQALAGRIASECFTFLDAPVKTLGSVNTPAIPVNEALEKLLLPGVEKTAQAIGELLAW